MFTDLDRDAFMVSRTAYEEASGEGVAGIQAQIWSQINRHKAGKWYSGATQAETCLVGFAYSAWNTTDPNRRRAMRAASTDITMGICEREAYAALQGKGSDPTGGATHYYEQGTPEPTWVPGDPAKGIKPATFCIQIGHHLFYKDVA